MNVGSLERSAALGDAISISLLRKVRQDEADQGAPFANPAMQPPKMAGLGTCTDCYA